MTSSVGQVGLPPINVQNLAYQGPPLNYVPVVKANRNPTTADINYNTICEWTNTETLDIWKLYGFNDGLADWRLLATGGGSGGGILTLSDDGGTKAPPDGTGDVQLYGGSGITTTTSGTSITIALTGGGTAFQGVTVDGFTPPGTNPVLPNAGGVLVVTGEQVAAGTVGANSIQSYSSLANTLTMQIQQSDVSAAKDTTLNGVAHFNSNQFTVDEGYISIISGDPTEKPISEIFVDTNEGTGTDPVIGDASGGITLTANQVAANTVGARAMRTDSIAANQIEIQIQRADKAAATDVAKNGICHFDSGSFDIDANGFVTLAAGTVNIQAINVDAFVPPGTNPVVASGAGEITVGGSLVAAGTTPIQSISLAANAYDIEVQTSQSAAASDVTKNGLSHFKSADFNVDADGYVSLVNPYPGGDPDFQNLSTEIFEDFFLSTAPQATGSTNKYLAISNFTLDYTHAYDSSSHPGVQYNVISTTLPQYMLWGEYSGNNVNNSYIRVAICAKFITASAASRVNMGLCPYSLIGTVDGAFFGVRLITGVYTYTANCRLASGSITSVDLIPIDSNWHVFEVICDTAAPYAQFYIDGTLLTTITTNVPNNKSSFGITVQKDGATGTGLCDFIYVKFLPYGNRY